VRVIVLLLLVLVDRSGRRTRERAIPYAPFRLAENRFLPSDETL